MSIIPNSGLSMRQMVYVVGKLDTIQHSTRKFTLRLNDGHKVRCVLVEGDVQELAKLFGQRVGVTGMAVHDLGRRLLRIEVAHVRPDEERGGYDWSCIPTPMHWSPLPPEEPTPRPFGLAAPREPWPGDETDEEWLKMIEELS
jgi:hypothetical protein